MRILFVSDTYYPHVNGVYYFVCRIGPMLQEKGHQVAVIAPSETFSFTKKKIDGLNVYGLPSFSLLLYRTIRLPIPVLMKARLKKIFKEFKPDIIHLQDHFFISKAVLSLNKHWKIPVIATNHFMPENITVLVKNERLKQRLTKFLWKGFSKVFNQVDLVTTPTETGVTLIQSKLKTKAIAISSGIDFKQFNPKGNTQAIKEKYRVPNKPVLLYVGRLDPEKRIEEIIQSAAKALQKIDFCVVIVGKGNSKASLEKLSQQLGITENVLFTGFVPDEDLPYFYKLANCFIISSIAELLSLVTLQAMASGLPIIAINAGALSELVKDQKNGFLYNEGDITKIINSITSILTNDELQKDMGIKSIEYVQQHDIYKTLQSFENIYISYGKKEMVSSPDFEADLNK